MSSSAYGKKTDIQHCHVQLYGKHMEDLACFWGGDTSLGRCLVTNTPSREVVYCLLCFCCSATYEFKAESDIISWATLSETLSNSEEDNFDVYVLVSSMSITTTEAIFVASDSTAGTLNMRQWGRISPMRLKEQRKLTRKGDMETD